MTDGPKSYQGIMLSSTFTDLEAHRQKAKLAIERLGFHAVGMETSGAQTADVISVSLAFVRNSAAYVGIITKKYGQTPEDSRNPHQRSITELEFDEALRLGLPILLFIMSDDHLVRAADVEPDAAKKIKLEEFTERAKLMRSEGKVERVWDIFHSPEDFAARIGPAIGNLARDLETKPQTTGAGPTEPSAQEPPRPAAPALRALPPYIGSHNFVGRTAELDVLDDWASPADPHPLLLFEAMGGTGKSMLTWHWVNQRAPKAQTNWAGRFWYSFYEQGATLAGFCREALSYIKGLPVKAFQDMRSIELGEQLLAELDRRPWLLVLDGLERILVGYQRSNAAQLRDEEVDSIRDPLADRDPCLAIRPQDDELLRRLAAVTQSKLLVSTRLTPARLINNAGLAIPGVKRELLKGLRPADAEAMFRAGGVEGDSQAIQAFLQANCDGHPLVIGALAGLVSNYLPARGNFAAWRDDPAHGSKFHWAALDLVQSRNHILDEAIAALEPASLQLLQGLAILIGGADYPLLEAINPHLPARPREMPEPADPEQSPVWRLFNKSDRETAKAYHREEMERYAQYRKALSAWEADPAVISAPSRLAETVRNLEKRGLLQYDPVGRRYDLHPVVRGVASSRMSGSERASSGGRVVDYCRAASPKTWDHATKLEDVALGRQLVATLTGMGHFDEALKVFLTFSETLRIRLEAQAEALTLLKDFFPSGWDTTPLVESKMSQLALMNRAQVNLRKIDRKASINISDRLVDLCIFLDHDIDISILNVARNFGLSIRSHVCAIALNYAILMRKKDGIFVVLLEQFNIASLIGDKILAEELWRDLAGRKKPNNFNIYRPGDAESALAWFRFEQGELTEALQAEAEQVAAESHNRLVLRKLALLRGLWQLENDHPAAAFSLQQAITMARAVGQEDTVAEAALALARLRNGDPDGARADAEALVNCCETAALYLAQVWVALGEIERGIAAARCAYGWAVGDGEPYVYRWPLTRARKLLAELGYQVPAVPQYDPASLPKFEWEPKLQAMIARIEAKRAKRRARKRAKPPQKKGGHPSGDA